MRKWIRILFLGGYQFAYTKIARPLIFRNNPQQAHEKTLQLLRGLDERKWTYPLLKMTHGAAFQVRPIEVGGVRLAHPMILAAGFVKGQGFGNEDEALSAVDQTIIPGWRSMPLLVGAVEFGSFTRWPRMGNTGTAIWRDVPTQSTQNRIGLKNPGAQAAAEFLARRKKALPLVFGINIAVSPGVTDAEQEKCEVVESIAFFLARGIRPAWLTLNLSCPNTEDDPGAHQTASRARDLCHAVVELVQDIPLWVKIGPDLADQQYQALLRIFEETKVRAVIATNTLGQPTPDNLNITAGVGGGKLHSKAVEVVKLLMAEKQRQGYQLDIIGCGGVMDGQTYADFTRHGIKAMQYWSALVYRGPLVAAIIQHEKDTYGIGNSD
ncbi:MAG: hypothetical protein HY862_11780 [Chloroflexi bacterium]|nr:hypothetical protein [Chloroflexota bacterium]